MSKELEMEFLRMAREMRQKYVYFLLAATGASVGFAVTQTRGQPLTWIHLPLAGALLCWAASFVLGCRYLKFKSSSVTENGRALQLLSGGNLPTASPQQKLRVNAHKRLFTKFEKIAANAFKWQSRTFWVGAAFFLTWHVLEMASVPAKPFWT